MNNPAEAGAGRTKEEREKSSSLNGFELSRITPNRRALACHCPQKRCRAGGPVARTFVHGQTPAYYLFRRADITRSRRNQHETHDWNGEDKSLHSRFLHQDHRYYATAKIELEMLAKAMNEAKSADPLKVAKALGGMKYRGDTGEVRMREDDHQLMQPLYIATFTRMGGPVKYDAEGTGFGWKTDMRIEAKDPVLPTTCKMERP